MYAGKQHRYRAETIVLTENAFAYNRGAHMGVGQSIAQGLMGRCEMVWTTAGTNRVCSRCLALKDTVVGHTDESGVSIPPLHPRCRCALMYREVETPRVMQPKPRPEKPKEITTADCKTFDELKTYWANNYGATIRDGVKRLDFVAVKEACTGFETAMNLIPATRQYLKEMRTKRGSGWLMSYTYEDQAVNFNQAMFLPQNIASTWEAILATSTIVKNSTIKSMAAH